MEKIIYLSLSLICFGLGLGGLYSLQFQSSYRMAKMLPYCFGAIALGIFFLARIFTHRKCPNCKNEVSKNETYCPHCNTLLKKEKRIDSKKIILFGIVLLFMMGGLLMVMPKSKEPSNSDYVVYESVEAIKNKKIKNEVKRYVDYIGNLTKGYECEISENYTFVDDELISASIKSEVMEDLSLELVYGNQQWQLKVLGYHRQGVPSPYGLTMDYQVLPAFCKLIGTDPDPIENALMVLVIREPIYDGKVSVVVCERGNVEICYENSLLVSYTYIETIEF